MADDGEWLQGFFQDPWLEVQRQLWSQEQTQAQADAILELLHPAPGAKILDAPCGEGRMSIELAARGYDLTGIDITEPLLQDARKKAAERGLRIRFEHGDMRQLPWQEEFDAVICWWGSFGFFDEEGNRAQAESAARALKSGGLYLIDTQILDSLLPIFQLHDWRRVGDILVLEERRWDHERGRVEADWTLVSQGTERTIHSSIRVYTFHELCELLKSSGFSSCAGYDASRREPFAFGSRRLIMVATK